MTPWKISVGITATLLAVLLLVAGERIAYLRPYAGTILSDYWIPIAWYGGWGLVTVMTLIYATARALGLADTGVKVELMERSIRRGEGGQSELAEKLAQEERGQFPGA